MLRVPVTAEQAAQANAAQLHDEARGQKANWPACFRNLGDDDAPEWVYEVQRDDLTDDDRQRVEQAIAGHDPEPVEVEPSVDERLARIEERLDRAAKASVTGEAAKLRDNLKAE